MNLVFLGPPGAGKGTQAAVVSHALNIPHISTGDMFRKAMREGTPTGLKAKAYIDNGQLVPDSVTIEMVQERLAEADCANGYLLDGFPRNLDQANALDTFSQLTAVVDIAVADEKLIARLSGRRVCPACGGTYHITKIGDAKKCPECGSIYLCIEDITECPNCLGVELIPLDVTATYECSSRTCGFRLQRSQVGNPFGDYQYVCDRNTPVRALKRTKLGDEVAYQCDKRCALMNCRKIRSARSRGVECKALDLLERNYNVYIADLVNACANCESRICKGCDFSIDVDGTDNFTGRKGEISCIGCREASCKPYVVKPGGECPSCKSKLVSSTPTTFDSFAKFIWNFKTGFVRNFETSCDRIEKIVETLGNKDR